MKIDVFCRFDKYCLWMHILNKDKLINHVCLYYNWYCCCLLPCVVKNEVKALDQKKFPHIIMGFRITHPSSHWGYASSFSFISSIHYGSRKVSANTTLTYPFSMTSIKFKGHSKFQSFPELNSKFAITLKSKIDSLSQLKRNFYIKAYWAGLPCEFLVLNVVKFFSLFFN